MRSRLLLAPIFAACLLAGCSDREEDSLFSEADARSVAQRFHDALSKSDVPMLVKLSRVPFRYKDARRVWPDAAALQANFAKEAPRIQHLTQGLDRIEVFSRRDLLTGKWPRDRDVPKKQREGEIASMGIEANGWLVRVCSETKPGYMLVLNPEGLDHLAVQVLEI